jgi:putative colanic acid biosynthesis acetyltransferase WcaF
MASDSGSTPLKPRYRHQASFTMGNKLLRVVWMLTWLLLARPTLPQMHAWRRLILRFFGAELDDGVRIYPNCRIWLPSNLKMGRGSMLGRGVDCYNQGMIQIGQNVVVSQNATLCASTHDINDPLFPLIVRPILIENDVWIAAEAFVGPGVTVAEGAVLGARGVAMRNLEAWTFYSGNPAMPLKGRERPS